MGLIVVQYFYDLPALALAKRQLEVEGIEVISRDEISFQVYGPEGLGGAKLLVNKEDYARASQILIEGGFIDANDNPQDFQIVDFLDKIGRSLFGKERLSKELRLFLVLIILFSIPFGLAILFSL